MHNPHLDTLGYDEWRRHAAPFDIPDDFSPARVIEVNRNRYVVSDGQAEIEAELSGRFLYGTDDATELPTVGDWVAVQRLDGDSPAIVHALLPRGTVLKRKESGRRVAFQLVAANIDVGLVVQSADAPNVNLLDRYFVMLNEAGIRGVAVCTKTDLVPDTAVAELARTMEERKWRHVCVSNVAEGGTDKLSNSLMAGTTYCLLGQSGVGKTSLLNSLLGTDELRVGDVRATDGRGRHTTVRRQLICLASGSMFIDTPGIRELGNFGVGTGLAETFGDLAGYASQCRFRDCTHTHEEGCAILAAVAAGDIDDGRYQNYLKLRKEAEFYDMSYQDRRRKDKSFGKMVKNFKKSRGKLL